MHHDGTGPRCPTQSEGNLLDFLSWVAVRPRSYAETMEAWRTSCPRLTAWEDAGDAGLVRLDRGRGERPGAAAVRLTEQGAARLVLAGTGTAPRATPASAMPGMAR